MLVRARAIETGSYVIAPAQGGRHECGRETYGHSLIVDPWGCVMSEGGEEPGIWVADIEPPLAASARACIPALAHSRPISLEPMRALHQGARP
jgi:predicted amidohydrolase